MNNFLHDLHKKQTDKKQAKKKRGYEKIYQQSPPRFNYQQGMQDARRHSDTRQTAVHSATRKDIITPMLAEAIDTLNNAVEIMVQNQTHMIDLRNKTAKIVDVLEKQSICIEKLLDTLNIKIEHLFSNRLNLDMISEKKKGHKVLSREVVMKIIYEMRAKKIQYGKIAEHLIKLKQPTFSGRGTWHAQTIYGLLKNKKK